MDDAETVLICEATMVPIFDAEIVPEIDDAETVLIWLATIDPVICDAGAVTQVGNAPAAKREVLMEAAGSAVKLTRIGLPCATLLAVSVPDQSVGLVDRRLTITTCACK